MNGTGTGMSAVCGTNGNGNENTPAKRTPMHANFIRALFLQNYVRRMLLYVQHEIRQRKYTNKYAIHAKCREIVTFYKSDQELYCQ